LWRCGKSYPRIRRVATAPVILLQPFFMGNTSFFGGMAMGGPSSLIVSHNGDDVNRKWPEHRTKDRTKVGKKRRNLYNQEKISTST